ncbi:hypothetical protein [Acetobacter musti]|uniref:hypothetical protein n=1 Tax=Acetobacter musti TaxID=864732 RepID=UPI0038D25A4F
MISRQMQENLLDNTAFAPAAQTSINIFPVAEPLIEKLEERQITVVIPSRKTVVIHGKYCSSFIKKERFFVRLKQFRDIATRCDRLESILLAAAQLVSAIIGIN